MRLTLAAVARLRSVAAPRREASSVFTIAGATTQRRSFSTRPALFRRGRGIKSAEEPPKPASSLDSARTAAKAAPPPPQAPKKKSTAAAQSAAAQPVVRKERIECKGKVETLPFAFNIWEAQKKMTEHASILHLTVHGDPVSRWRRRFDNFTRVFGMPVKAADEVRVKLLRLEAVYLPMWLVTANGSIEATSKYDKEGHLVESSATTTVSMVNARFPGCYWPPVHELPIRPPTPEEVDYKLFSPAQHPRGPAMRRREHQSNVEYEGLEALADGKEPRAIVLPFSMSPLSVLDVLRQASPETTTLSVPTNMMDGLASMFKVAHNGSDLLDEGKALANLPQSKLRFKGSTMDVDMLAASPVLVPIYIAKVEGAPGEDDQPGRPRVIAIGAWDQAASDAPFFHGFTSKTRDSASGQAAGWLGSGVPLALKHITPQFTPRVPLPMVKHEEQPSEARERLQAAREKLEAMWDEHVPLAITGINFDPQTDPQIVKQKQLKAERDEAMNAVLNEEINKAHREQRSATVVIGMLICLGVERLLAKTDWQDMRTRDKQRAEYRLQGLLDRAEDTLKKLGGTIDWHDKRIQRYSETYEENLAYIAAVRHHSDRKVETSVDERIMAQEGIENLAFEDPDGQGRHITQRDRLLEAARKRREAEPAWLKAYKNETTVQRGGTLKRKPFTPPTRKR